MPSDTGYTQISDTDPEEEGDEQDKKSKDEKSPLDENKRPESRLDKIKNVFHKTGYPSSVWYILGNEFCERFSYYGMHAILVIYLTQMLKMDDDSATAIYHAFNMLCYFSPIFGAMLADSFLGKYKTILYVSIIYATGNIVVAVTSIPSILSAVRLAGPMFGLLLIAIGTGGIKPCVSAFGGDQFRADQEDLLQSFFSIFYFAINLGSFLSMIVTPIFRGDVRCFGYDCYPLAFGVPALLMILSVALFICGRNKYRKVPPEGNVVLLVCCAVGNAIEQRIKHSGSSEKKEHWMDWAEAKYGPKMVKDIKALFKVLFMFLPLPVFWTLFDQQGSRWTLQAEEMDGDIGELGTIKPDQMQALNPVFILLLIPIFEKIIYPLLRKCNLLERPLQRMCAGMLFAALSFIMAAFLQVAIQRSRNPVEIPPANYANLRFINAGLCDLKVTGHGLNLDVHGTQPSSYQQVPVSLKNLKVEARNCTPLPAPKTFSENLTEHQVHTFVVATTGGNVNGKELLDSIKPLKQGLVLVRFLYAGGDVFPKIDISINKTRKYEGLMDLTGTEYHKIYSQHYTVRIYEHNTTKELLKQSVYFGNGGIFSVVIKPANSNNTKLTLTKVKDVKPSSVSMLWQIPQYLTMTTGEVLFSITGLEFAYSQSPVSMKSVIMAGWLLTVSIGNAIVVIFAEARVTQNMAHEFFFFAGLLGIVLLIFMVMSYFYKYETFSVNGVVQEPASDEIPLTDRTAETG